VVKRILSIALTLALLLSVCVAGQALATEEKVEVNFLIWANETEAATAQGVLDVYNASQDHTVVTLSYVPETEYITKVNTLAAAGELPDVAMGREAVVLKWAANGLLADLSQMYAGGAAPLPSLAFTYEGSPVSYSAANEVLLLYYNRDLFDAAGIPYPPAAADKAWTWAEFVDVAKKLTKDASGKTAGDEGFNPDDIITYGAYVDTLTWMWPIFAVSNGGGLVSADGKEILLDKPESIAAAQAIADLYLVDHVAPAPAAAASFPTLDVTLLSGQVAMATGGQWNIGTTLVNSLADGLHYGVAVLPKFEQPVTYNTGGPIVVFNSSKHPAEAMEFVKWYTQEENNWGLIETGIWMPILDSWYKDEALTHKWVDNPNFPPYDEYKTAAVDYAMNNAVQVPWYFLPCYSRLEEVVDSAMGDVWLGAKTAEQAITEIAPRLKEILADGSAD
jgi:multiple sugar transport system substrate-binding protein